MTSRFLIAPIAILLTTALGAPAWSAGEHAGGHGPDIGSPGQPGSESRTVEVIMLDNVFEPEVISVKAGETVRFSIRNEGELVHEFAIGTAAMHADHQKEMMKMVEHGVLFADRIDYEMMKMDMGHGQTMEHDDPNSVLLEPGKSAEIIWTFDVDTELEFACNVPGHYESGMVGEIEISR